MRIAALIFAALFLRTPLRADDRTRTLAAVGFDQKLDAAVPPELTFRDEGGRVVRFDALLGGKPTILALVYYQCPMLCTETLNGLVRALRALSFDAGRHFNVVIASIDPRETPALAAAKKAVYVERYGRPGAAQGWTFLTGDEASIRRLAAAVGFRYAYDPDLRQYAHATGLVVLTPGGRVSRYLYGVEYPAGDVRLALVEAAAGKIGSPVDLLLLYCYHYDPLSGRYGLIVTRVLRAAGALTVLLLAALILGLRPARRSAA
jgi:protein SCO1/2